jgi:hypothetical protein
MLSLTMFFDAAKNAATPNIVTSKELLTANVLMLSNRFLQYTLGVALGGLVAARFGYTTAFVVNSLSFIGSALFIAPISGDKMRKLELEGDAEPTMNKVNQLTVDQLTKKSQKPTQIHFFSDLKEGLRYIWATPFVRAVILVNIAWATGGGMPNILFEQVGGHIFKIGDRGDWSVAAMFASAGLGVFLGMVLARRVGDYLVEERRAAYFIGWSLLAHGIIFAAAGFATSLLTMLPFIAASRFLLGLEFGVQETMVMRVLPDDYRGRVFTTDRSLEFCIMTFSMGIATWLLNYISPLEAFVLSGLLSASPGLFWLLAISVAKFRVPSNAVRESYGD